MVEITQLCKEVQDNKATCIVAKLAKVGLWDFAKQAITTFISCRLE